MPMTDKWSGLADLLATLIERHAAELDLEHLPNRRDEPEEKEICESYPIDYQKAA